MLFNPVLNHLLQRPLPQVRLVDLMDSVADSNTYTFSNRPLNAYLPGGGIAAHTTGVTPFIQSHSRGMLVANIHSEAAAVDWSLTSITLGGVAATIGYDRLGATSAVNTVMAAWPISALANIANTDIVVTHSKSVTSTAVGILLVTNIAFPELNGGDGDVGTVTLSIAPAGSGLTFHNAFGFIGATTCVTGGGTEKVSFDNGVFASKTSSMPGHILLYESNNAEIDFACAWNAASFVMGLTSSTHFGTIARWSGSGAGDLVGCHFQ
jgi:hypothetical protein